MNSKKILGSAIFLSAILMTSAQAQDVSVDDPRQIQQDPMFGIVSPQYRFQDMEPDSGGAGDVHYITNVTEYEQNVAGNVYSPILSSEYVNKLYVDNSFRSIINNYETQITVLKQDITNITNILEAVCNDMLIIETNGGSGHGNKNGWYKNGKAYRFQSALGETCGGIEWKTGFTPYGHILNAGKDDGSTDYAAGNAKSYAAFDGESEPHADWGFLHNVPTDRSVRFKPKRWSDTDGDGRDDKSYDMYRQGYDIGYR